MTMRYRRLGTSGLQLSELSLGSWLTFGKQISDDTAEALMKLAYDNGINFFDNAEIYSKGESERVMGRILKKMEWPRDTWTVSSKVFFARPAPQARGGSLSRCLEAPTGGLSRPLFLPPP